MIETEFEPIRENRKDNNYDGAVDDDDNLTVYGKIRDDEVDDNTAGAFTNNKNKDDNNDLFDSQQAKDIESSRNYALLVAVSSILLIVVTFIVSYYVSSASVENKFQRIAEKLLGSLATSFDMALGSLDSTAVSFDTIAASSNQIYPFVTIPYYGIHIAKSVLPLTKSLEVTVMPVVRGLEQRLQWEQYAAMNNTYLPLWINQTIDLQENWSKFYGPKPQSRDWYWMDQARDFVPMLYKNDTEDGVYLPTWQRFPLVDDIYAPGNEERYKDSNVFEKLLDHPVAAIGQPYLNDPGDSCEHYQKLLPDGESCMEPISDLHYPIVSSIKQIDLNDNNNVNYGRNFQVKALISVSFRWKSWITGILQDGTSLDLVISNTCNNVVFTYRVDGSKAKYMGPTDLHIRKYDYLVRNSTLIGLWKYQNGHSEYSGFSLTDEECSYMFNIYPDEAWDKKRLVHIQSMGATLFVFILLPLFPFFFYHRKLIRQRKQILASAQRSNEIVSSLFPSSVRDRLHAIVTEYDKSNSVMSVFGGSDDSPIAELYPETTVLFADIAGFTAWSSVRDPNQVFTLLETIYSRFDRIADQRKVFKVETIGDCYVAVTGLPEDRSDHAVAMVKFAQAIIDEMRTTTIMLERRLGPGTSNLSVRVGINSGPTTAGVLRGAKGRFQLFGDTVNTAARMESNSLPGKIMCSEKTKDILVAANKGHWVSPNLEIVHAKGKGEMTCYWCHPKKPRRASLLSHASTTQATSVDEGGRRDVAWMVKLFEDMLVSVIADRRNPNIRQAQQSVGRLSLYKTRQECPRDEVSEIIVLNIRATDDQIRKDSKISDNVRLQLDALIMTIASLYRNNPFHNFEHACHVVLTAKKLLDRVVQTNDSLVSSTAYGITSDPLAQFAILFSALVHDVDHPGISNEQLVKENAYISDKYHGKSVAEQNSVSLAWELLMEERFNDLRETIMPNEADCKLFRQVVVNSVMATDLFDTDLRQLRENRWQIAFGEEEFQSMSHNKRDVSDDSNRRATIVIEHIIQASDVGHTMQHWHIYQKWNKKLFIEMYEAYKCGRAEKDPAEGWYDGEIWFFDNYVIPLAKKLKTCGVFGVSCDELLDYATDNRNEWALKGNEIVAEYCALAQCNAFCKSRRNQDESVHISMTGDSIDEEIDFDSNMVEIVFESQLSDEIDSDHGSDTDISDPFGARTINQSLRSA